MKKKLGFQFYEKKPRKPQPEMVRETQRFKLKKTFQINAN